VHCEMKSTAAAAGASNMLENQPASNISIYACCPFGQLWQSWFSEAGN